MFYRRQQKPAMMQYCYKTMPFPCLGEQPWFSPEWDAPARVRALMSWRGADATHGASRAPYAHFNLGAHVGDAPEAVAANRAQLAAAMHGARPVWMNQVHGARVLTLDAASPGAPPQDADAAATRCAGVACAVMVADCLPVLLADAAGRAVAAAHAGWRSLAAGVLEGAVARVRGLAGESDAEVLAWLGPCIGPAAFEVGGEVRAAFLAAGAAADICFLPHGKRWLASLPALACQRLLACGVQCISGNDGSTDWCTFSQPERWYSYRRDGGATGRMAACVWLE